MEKTKTMEQLQAEIDLLQSKLAEEKAATDEVQREYDRENGTLKVSFQLPKNPIASTKSGNSRYIKQHYRYWSIPGLPGYKVKLDVIRKTDGNNDE